MTFGKAWAISIFAFAILMAPAAAEAQQPGKAVRIAWLGLSSPGPEVLRIVDAVWCH